MTSQHTPTLGFFQKACLATRVGLGSIAAVALGSIALFWILGYLIHSDIATIQQAETSRSLAEVSDNINSAKQTLLSISNSIIRDEAVWKIISRANESSRAKRQLDHYVEKISKLHNLDSVTYWDTDGGLIAANQTIIGNMSFGLSSLSDNSPRFPQVGIVELGGGIWVVSTAPLIRGGAAYGMFQVSVNINSLAPNGKITSQTGMSTPANIDESPKNLFTGHLTANGDRLHVAFDQPIDRLIDGLDTIKYLALYILLMALTVSAFVWLLIKRATRPLKTLSQSIEQVGHGDFNKTPVTPGPADLISIQKAFNGMIDDLSRLNQMKRRLQQQKNLIVLGKISTRIAHDINNPLSVIRSISSLSLYQRPKIDTDDFFDDMKKIYDESSKCLTITDSILSLVRDPVFSVEPVDVVEICQSYLSERAKYSHGFKYNLKTNGVSKNAIAENNYLRIILDNLIDNAVEANDGELVNVELFCDNELLCIKIRDDGTGFPANGNEADVFDFFFTTKATGSGLGLANALSIATSMGGGIEISDAARGEICVFLLTATPENISERRQTNSPYYEAGF
ncbi:MAG: HAMP domain-containing sensor histidine kinase [Halothiobacillaceae bacterium]